MSNSLKMGGYALLDAFVHYRFSRDWRIEARANNLLDKRYETAWGMAPRAATSSWACATPRCKGGRWHPQFISRASPG